MKRVIKNLLLLILLGGILGGALGLWYRTPWRSYEPPDRAFSCEFRQNPIQMGFPKPKEFTFVRDDSIKIYSYKGEFGIDEINRFDVLESAEAQEQWFEVTVKQSGGTLLKGSKDDFTLLLPAEGAYFRGRIVYAPDGRGIYKIFSVRGSAEELSTLETERFLFGLKFPGE